MARISYEQLEKSLGKAIDRYVKEELIRQANQRSIPSGQRQQAELLQVQQQRQAGLLNLLNQHPAQMRAQFLKWGISIEEVRHLAEQKELFSLKQQEVFGKIVELLQALHGKATLSNNLEQNSAIVQQQRQSAVTTKFVKQRKNWHPL